MTRLERVRLGLLNAFRIPDVLGAPPLLYYCHCTASDASSARERRDVLRPEERLSLLRNQYLVRTEYGPVVVTVNEECENALENDLILLHVPSPQELGQFEMETPLRAFAQKMIDIIQTVGTGSFDPGERMRDMLIQEKATSDLGRIERFARDNPPAQENQPG